MIVFEPPANLAATFFVLDDVVFHPDGQYPMEKAVRCCRTVGEVLHDGDGSWCVRKMHNQTGEMSDWRKLRSLAEARAYLVSKIKP